MVHVTTGFCGRCSELHAGRSKSHFQGWLTLSLALKRGPHHHTQKENTFTPSHIYTFSCNALLATIVFLHAKDPLEGHGHPNHMLPSQVS